MKKTISLSIIFFSGCVHGFSQLNAESEYRFLNETIQLHTDVRIIVVHNCDPVSLNYLVSQKEDTTLNKRISAFTWMPEGNSIILNIVQTDKTEKAPPSMRKFIYNINTETIEPLEIDGGGLVVSPDGKTVAYIKQMNGKDQIYLYNIPGKEDKPLVNDTLKKYAISWSPKGKSLVYNIQTGKGANAKVDICTYNIQTKKVKQITKNIGHKCYTPVWNPKKDIIVYTAEKGDNHDQIFLTDKKGSFHTNLTNDSTTHNYSPFWLDETTILYLQAPGDIMTMKMDGSNKQKIEGISTNQFKYNFETKSILYLDIDGNLMIAELKNKTRKILIQQNQLNALLDEYY